MAGDGLSFPVSDAVNGELYSAGNWAEANRVAGDQVRRGETGTEADDVGEVYHHNTSTSSMV